MRRVMIPGGVDRDLVAALGRSGLLGDLLPREFGGRVEGTPSAVALCVAREGLASESAAAETAFALQGLGSYPLLIAGSPTERRRWLPGVTTGSVVAAFALTEPGAGSDAAAVELRADPDGSGFRLTGVKKWISNAPVADFYTVFARTTPGVGARGITAFAVPGESPGLTGSPLHLIGKHAIGELTFDGVRVAREAMIGELDRGFAIAMRTLDRFRPSVGAGAVGMAQSALELAIAHAGTRQAFGHVIGSFQAIAHLLASLATQLEAARLLVAEAAEAHDSGSQTASTLSAMAKLFATETGQQVVDGAVQVLGARGLERGHPLALLYENIRALRIYEGTSQIQQAIIARHLLADTPGQGR